MANLSNHSWFGGDVADAKYGDLRGVEDGGEIFDAQSAEVGDGEGPVFEVFRIDRSFVAEGGIAPDGFGEFEK